MRLTKRLLFVAPLFFILCGAYGQDVYYNYASATQFAAYKTYQWVDIPGGAVPDQFIDESVKRAVDEQLAQKGLTRVDKCADLYIAYEAAIDEENSVSLSATGSSRGAWSGFRTVQGKTASARIGTLLVDIYDPAIRHLVWRGDANKSIDLRKDPDKNYKKLQKAMANLFKNYPPQPNK